MKRILKKVKNFHISHLVKLLQTFIRNSIDCMNEHLDVKKIMVYKEFTAYQNQLILDNPNN